VAFWWLADSIRKFQLIAAQVKLVACDSLRGIVSNVDFKHRINNVTILGKDAKGLANDNRVYLPRPTVSFVINDRFCEVLRVGEYLLGILDNGIVQAHGLDPLAVDFDVVHLENIGVRVRRFLELNDRL